MSLPIAIWVFVAAVLAYAIMAETPAWEYEARAKRVKAQLEATGMSSDAAARMVAMRAHKA